jgi:hypothetical protein
MSAIIVIVYVLIFGAMTVANLFFWLRFMNYQRKLEDSKLSSD